MFINDQCFDHLALNRNFFDAMLKEDIDYWWMIGVEGFDYWSLYCAI